MGDVTKLDASCAQVKRTLEHYKGVLPRNLQADKGLLSAAAIRGNLAADMKGMVNQMDAMRKGSKDRRCINVSFDSYMQTKLGFSSWDGLYTAMGIDPSHNTIQSLSNVSDFDEGFRWLIPEIFRAAVQLGLRRAPIYPSLIAGEESVSQLKVTMPSIEMSASTPENVNESETIPVGDVSFNQRDVAIRKIGTGLKISDEVLNYVSINILSLYLQDVGVKLGLGLDTMALDVLINGDDPTGGFTAPVIGVENPAAGIVYRDILRGWIRMGRIGRMPSGMLTDETQGINLMELPEFKGANYNNTKQNINLRTPVPQTQEHFIHGAMPADKKLGLYDAKGALIKLNATGLMVESQRIAERQTTGSYVTISTGFARMFRDAFLIIDGTQDFNAGAGFPTYMDVDAAEQVKFM